jgi:hydrogenase expression/formation protein HypC
MCLAVPTQIISIDESRTGTVEISGVQRRVALDLVPDARVGDYVIIHVGFAIQILDEAEAARTLELLEGLNREQ